MADCPDAAVLSWRRYGGNPSGRSLEADRIDKTGERTPEGEVPTYEEYDLIVTNPPVGELPIEDQDRYWISTRKAQLQYMQMLMNHVKKQGIVIAVVNEEPCLCTMQSRKSASIC